MEDQVSSLQNLRDIVVPPPAPWWPLAPGWNILGAFALILLLYVLFRWRASWRASAYRREALALLETSSDSLEIAKVLKRTALAAAPRTEVASLTGSEWCDWLEQTSSHALPPSLRETLSEGVFSQSPSDPGEFRTYAITWVKTHQPLATPNKAQ